jgi:hypothetical protein
MTNETTPKVTDSERLAHAVRKVSHWVAFYEANGARHTREGREEAARSCAAHAQDLRDVLAMLDGTEDSYIAALARQS